MQASMLRELGRGHGGGDDGKRIAFAMHVVKPRFARAVRVELTSTAGEAAIHDARREHLNTMQITQASISSLRSPLPLSPGQPSAPLQTAEHPPNTLLPALLHPIPSDSLR
jgi:hypothetical protein